MGRYFTALTVGAALVLGLTPGFVDRGTAQPTSGAAAYREVCAECHGAQLEGGAHAPALTGTGFLSVWGNRSAEDLFEYLRAEMPPGRARQLSDETYRLIAALLREPHPAVLAAAPGAGGIGVRPKSTTTLFGDRKSAQLTPVTVELLHQPPAADCVFR